jgi:hypothetical membrane protein
MFTRFAGLFGVLTSIFTLTLIFVSVALSPGFDWHEDALSDMGVSSTALLFNSSLLIGGALYLVFGFGFIRWHGVVSAVAKIAGLLMLLGGVGLLLIGVFPENAGRIHYVVAITYFIATPLAYALFGLDLLKRGEPVPGISSIAAGLGALSMILFVPHQGWAVPEILAAVVMGAWTLSFGVKMLVEGENSHG